MDEVKHNRFVKVAEKRMEVLREFIPNAKSDEWEIVVAGQRVQVIKDTDAGKGTLQFGTEVVSASDETVLPGKLSRVVIAKAEATSRDSRRFRFFILSRLLLSGITNSIA